MEFYGLLIGPYELNNFLIADKTEVVAGDLFHYMVAEVQNKLHSFCFPVGEKTMGQ